MSSHCVPVLACTGLALALKPITWNWPLSGSCAVIHSTMSSARRHFCAERRMRLGLVAQLDHLGDVLVHHARGGVEQHEDAFALHLQRADVLAIAAAAEGLHAIAGRRLVERATLQALDAFFAAT